MYLSMNLGFWLLFFLSSGCVQGNALVKLGYQFQERGWVAGGESSFRWLQGNCEYGSHRQHSFLSIVVQFSSGCMCLKAVSTTPLSFSMLYSIVAFKFKVT